MASFISRLSIWHVGLDIEHKPNRYRLIAEFA